MKKLEVFNSNYDDWSEHALTRTPNKQIRKLRYGLAYLLCNYMS